MPPCRECGRTTKNGPYCARHQPASLVKRKSASEREICRRVVLSWVEVNGSLCSGWEHEPHFVNENELTVDHDPPLSIVQDPANWQGDRIVLCQSCNSRRGTRL